MSCDGHMTSQLSVKMCVHVRVCVCVCVCGVVGLHVQCFYNIISMPFYLHYVIKVQC